MAGATGGRANPIAASARSSRVAGSTTCYTGQAQFGSAHATSLHAAACDGSVHVVAYGIDPAVLESLGRRNDGGEATW